MTGNDNKVQNSVYDNLIFLQEQNQANLKNFFKNYKKDSADRKTKSYFEKRLCILEEYFAKIKSVHSDLLKVLYEHETELAAEPYFKDNEFSTLESLYLQYYDHIQEDFLGKFPLVTENSSLVTNLNATLTQPSGGSSNHHNDFKIQKVQIPQFQGDYDSWLTFRDLFNASVHESQMSNANKLWTLKSLLTGPAADLLSDYTISDGDYVSAWQMLNDRFNNTRVLVNNELKGFLNLPIIKNENSHEIKNLYDKTKRLLSRLKHLKVETANWDAILVFLISQKLPKDTHQLWEQTLTVKTVIPSLSDLIDFLLDRFRTLEAITRSNPATDSQVPKKTNTNSKSFHLKTKTKCCLCNQDHFLRLCPKFLAQSVDSRFHYIKSKKGCINCLSTNHTVGNCTSRFTCQQCQKKHHSTLHRNNPNKMQASNSKPESAAGSAKPDFEKNSSGPVQASTSFQSNNLRLLTHHTTNKCNVLLATAVVTIVHDNQSHTLRALIDPGSEISLILEATQRRIKLPTTSVSATISGMGGTQTAASTKKTYCVLTPHNKTQCIHLEAIVLKRLTGLLPSRSVETVDFSQFNDLELADSLFYKPQKIEMVLGADVYSQILNEGTVKSQDNKLIAQSTIFGWIISGVCGSSTPIQCHFASYFNSTSSSVDEQIRKFWEIEEIPAPKFLSADDEYCEEIYKSTTRRDSKGRYVVNLPFTKDYGQKDFLSHSRFIALNRFHHLESRLHKDIEQKKLYDQVLQDYLKLGHMSPTVYREPANIAKQNAVPHCYLPHHGVFKPSSTSTKLRVVFDASCKSLNGSSLNKVLMVGPTLQQDLMSIILRWRKYPYVFNADIEKMYRQIWINPEHAAYQRILYRNNTDLPVQDYQLNTVTFGVSSAPYLAIRTLLQLAEDEGANFPKASKIVRTDFYVDDVLSGAFNLKDAIAAQQDLRLMLKSGGFELRKWSSNDSQILNGIPQADLMPEPTLYLDVNPDQKTLGVYWNKKDDYFSFKISLMPIPEQITKRQLFSEIARLFDPAGWLGPVVIKAKILMQQVWTDGTEWDDHVRPERLLSWKSLMNELPKLEKLKIPRYLNFHPDHYVEVHGFCDASEQAYGAVLYLKTLDSLGYSTVKLIMAKTKVAPKKKEQLTIPRLELCGAVLLFNLLNSIKTILDIPISKLFAWCDSTIVLAWLKGSPEKWKTFVANRVAKITKGSEHIQWHHVLSSDNPADFASRGIMPSELLTSPLWWNGPSWLNLPSSDWPINPKYEQKETDLESKSAKSLTNRLGFNPLNELLTRFSSLSRALRVLSYCKRYIQRTFPTKFHYEIGSNVNISCKEIQSSLEDFVRASQLTHYFHEHHALLMNSIISSKSQLLPLNPFLDAKGILRMSGRLTGLPEGYNEKYPIILSPQSHLAKLILREAHTTTLHGGIQLMASVIRKRYWIPKLKLLLKTLLNHCKTCLIQKKQTMSQLMGILPNERVSVSIPFTNTGVDYAGPLTLKLFKGRCTKFTKGYIALFICFSTKAIHLEAVSDLSTQSFLDAFERFFSRRGLCQNIYSDNGTNFVGANATLTKQYKLAIKQTTTEASIAFAQRKINWHFIPPGAPHFGGLWEAGVKSVKNHLRKTVQRACLTFEELNTLLCRIEACLNSRPLTALSDDPNDLNPLTPGHFLRGEALLAPPVPFNEPKNLNQSKRLELLLQLKNEFWKRWKNEYLSQLQQRPKWKHGRSNLEVGDLVAIKSENNPPQFWSIGRVIATHPGADKLVRVATIRTAQGEFKRPISKLCLLPYEKDN